MQVHVKFYNMKSQNMQPFILGVTLLLVCDILDTLEFVSGLCCMMQVSVLPKSSVSCSSVAGRLIIQPAIFLYQFGTYLLHVQFLCQNQCHSVLHMNVGSNNHMINFTIDEQFGKWD